MADPLSIAAGVAGLLSLGLQTTNALVKFYTSHKDRNENIGRTTHRLETLQSAFDALQTALQQRKFQPDEETLIGRIESSIHSCAELIQELQEECTKLTGPLGGSFNDAVKVVGRRATYPFRESTLKKLEEDAGEMRNHLSFALDILQLRDHKTAQDELAEMKSLVELMRATQISSAVQYWFKAPDVSVDHNAACAKRHSGTGMWFVKAPVFHNWINQANSFLWLYGFAGCGKSVLCSTAIQYTFRQRGADQNVGIAFFYFTFNDESKRDESAMLRALLLQLAGQLPDGHSQLERLRNSSESGPPPPVVLIQYLRDFIQRFHQVYILIDALDESPRGNRRDEMLGSIMAMRGWSLPGLHLLVTSRDEPDIRESLDVAPAEKVAMKNDKVEQDISNYIAEKLATDSKLRTKWQSYRDLIQETLAKRANGVFRWVECQFEALKHCPRSERHLERCLKSLPRSLDETYERMLLNIDGASHEEARRALTLLCFSLRPLKVSELLHGIAVDLNEPAHLDRKSLLEGIDDLCEICPGLIDFGLKVDDDTISRSSEVTVRIAHFSVQEYLESDRILQQKAGFFAMSSISAHREIAAICCVYLLEPELSNADLTPAKLDDFPLAQFAAQFWYHHYQAGKGKTAQLSTLIMKIFKQQHDQFATWIKLHDPDDGLQNTAVKFERISDNVAPALYYASFLGLDWIIPEILLAGKTPDCKIEDVVNVQGGSYGNALQAASVGGHVETARILVEQGANINKEGGRCGYALEAASENGHVKIVEMLLSRGAEVNTKDRNALYAASERGHRKIVNLLVVAGADVNAYAEYGDYGYALQAASVKGHRGTVEMLIEFGADINAQRGCYNYPQGEGCCKCEFCCIADDDEFNTALQAASARGHREVVEILIDKGADVHIQGGPDGNALQAATKYGHQEIVRLLIEKGADVHALCGFSGSALQAAARHGHREIVQLLIEKGADVNALGGFSGYALQAAARHGDQEIVKLLIEKGANVNVQGGKIGYSLQVAARHGHLEIVKILIEKGADVNTDSKLYGNAVQAASSGGYSEIIEVLLENSADINAQGGAYGNALIAASWKGYSKITKLLLERGANANAQDGRYGNALKVASARGHVEIIEMLVQKGAISFPEEK